MYGTYDQYLYAIFAQKIAGKHYVSANINLVFESMSLVSPMTLSHIGTTLNARAISIETRPPWPTTCFIQFKRRNHFDYSPFINNIKIKSLAVFMKKISGLILSEVVSLIIVIVIVSAVGFGFYVSGQRDDMVASAELTLAAIGAQATKRIESDTNIPCDPSTIAADTMENEFLALTVKVVLVDPDRADSGYTLALYVHSNLEEDGGDSFVTAERLHDVTKEKAEYKLRVVEKSDDNIEYFILSSDQESCKNTA